MLTKNNIHIEDFETLSAEHESALNKIRELEEEDKITKEWKKTRFGYPSGSEIIRICGYENKNELPEGAYTYISEKVFEIVFQDEYKNLELPQFDKGKNYELEAVKEVEIATGLTFKNTGKEQKFLIHESGDFGSTPDGTSTNYTLEVKCPDFIAHNKFKRMKSGSELEKADKKYWLQVQTEIMCGKKKAGIFGSYYVNEKTGFTDLFWIRIDGCERTQNLIKSRAKLATIEIKKQVKEYQK